MILPRSYPAAFINVEVNRYSDDYTTLRLTNPKTYRKMSVVLTYAEIEDLKTALTFYQLGLDKQPLDKEE
jgi:hypothetical protein